MQAAFASPARAPLRPVASVLQEVARKATCEKSSGSMKARNNALLRTMGDGYIKPKTLWCPRRGAAPRSAPKADQVRAMQGVAVMATAAAAAAAVAAAAVTRPPAVELKPASTQAPAPSVA